MKNPETFDWNDIRTSLERSLGKKDMQGWIEGIDLRMQKMRIELGDYESLPKIARIKQESGSLGIYTEGSENARARQMLDDIAREVERSCESCGNAAQAQKIGSNIRTLCCHCYNRVLRDPFKENDGHGTRLFLDIAESYPDLVLNNCASLRPAVGRGWLDALDRCLQEMEHAVLEADLPPGTVQISDAKEKYGRISIGYHRYHDCVDLAEAQLELDTYKTCAICGHVGSRRRGKSGIYPACDHCSSQNFYLSGLYADAREAEYSHPVSLNDVPVPTGPELMTYHLGPLVAEIAAEFTDWHPITIIDQLLSHDPAENGRNLVDLVRDKDEAALYRVLEALRS
ncbi:hypothetical protein [uncultured Sulfitobacter sp.]|uniref:hypothetical protein n=1 Tax=Sulfitobacter sp. SH22 TaxID=3421172 RepID=UPI0025F55511|nr:hypothetical protein [uncultured Sulfitobacter sp.]